MQDKNYLDFVKSQDCVLCGKGPPNMAHHVRHHTGWSKRPTDYATIPLCYEHHDLVHNDPETFYITVPRGEVGLKIIELLNHYPWVLSMRKELKDVKD